MTVARVADARSVLKLSRIGGGQLRPVVVKGAKTLVRLGSVTAH
jgi:hypothetical protein